jgi:hypothetical protein
MKNLHFRGRGLSVYLIAVILRERLTVVNRLYSEKDKMKDFKRFPVICSSTSGIIPERIGRFNYGSGHAHHCCGSGRASLFTVGSIQPLSLSRTVSLPIFGKLADLFRTKSLFMISTTIFLLASVMAGSSKSMGFLIFSRVIQGIGAGGNFALVYVILTDVSSPEKRGKTFRIRQFYLGNCQPVGSYTGRINCNVFFMEMDFFHEHSSWDFIPWQEYIFISVEIRDKEKNSVPGFCRSHHLIGFYSWPSDRFS